MCGLMAGEGLGRSRGWPAGVARATRSARTLPPAPERFSTTTGWPSSACMRGWMMRATMSISPPGGYGTTMVTVRLGNACAAAAPLASRAATKKTILFIAPPRFLLALECGLSLFHEGSPALGIILAFEAFLHPRLAQRDVVIPLRHLADDALRRAHRERPVSRDHVAVFARRLLELGDRHYLVHEAHVQRFGGAELPPRDHDLARERGANHIDQVLHRARAVAESHLRRGDAETGILRSDAQVANSVSVEPAAHAGPD